jgi:hypothetical protein
MKRQILAIVRGEEREYIICDVDHLLIELPCGGELWCTKDQYEESEYYRQGKILQNAKIQICSPEGGLLTHLEDEDRIDQYFKLLKANIISDKIV